jgi:hypothetical protein
MATVSSDETNGASLGKLACETLYDELDRLSGTSLDEHIKSVYDKFAKDYDKVLQAMARKLL